MSSAENFNRYFGLSLRDRIDHRLVTIFLLTSSIFFITILITANVDYNQMNSKTRSILLNRYKEFVTEFVLDQEKQEVPYIDLDSPQPSAIVVPSASRSAQDIRADQRRQIEERISGSGILAELGNLDPYSDLPAVDDMVTFNENDVILDIEHSQNRRRLLSGSTGRGRERILDPGGIGDPVLSPFNYTLTRRGNIVIEFTDELIGERYEEPAGYRDPEEINRVVNHYRPMIEFCFNREARVISGLRGYVKVKFSISYKGYVIPESIRILNSTIRNRSVEQCIKNYIKRWRNFEELDESMGIAHVVQKFVFN